MLVLSGRNVNDLYYRGVNYLRDSGVEQDTRAGKVLVLNCPVMSVYERPYERVLFDEKRDANPFFHLMECMWMLAGRSDAAFLNIFVKDFGERFAEEDGHIWGAYGARWRAHFSDKMSSVTLLDQLTTVIRLLTENPDDRRVVISMWDPSEDLAMAKRDVPCNTQIYPRVVQGKLDLTVMCRSNDIIWGAYGANAVHFSFLQEVLAACIGVGVGRLYQLSNNWHGYIDVMQKQEAALSNKFYDTGMVTTRPIVNHPEVFFEEVENFCERVTDLADGEEPGYVNTFLNEVAAPMLRIHAMFREGGARLASNYVYEIKASDWQFACKKWLERRIK